MSREPYEPTPWWLFPLACLAVLMFLIALGKWLAPEPSAEILIDAGRDKPAIAAAVPSRGPQAPVFPGELCPRAAPLPKENVA